MIIGHAYTIAIIPFMKMLSSQLEATQDWYADDSAAVQTIADIHIWWKSLVSLGPAYGYFVNDAKTWLIVKEVESEVCDLFQGSQINITTAGKPYLGAPLGNTEAFIEDFVRSEVELWCSVVLSLTDVTFSSPHAACATFTYGIMSFWLFFVLVYP